ncbi:MAG: hypothetical protein ACRBG0_26675 [Lewinella sp.]|uniref:hypothetical protein n=1 Tax=Lewinella sp. TaxID=2004506 RepID=UPI003D6AE8CB
MIAKEEHLLTLEAQAKDQQIFISGRIWHELYPKVDPGLFLEVLGEKIDLKKYGDGIAKFYFTFVVIEKLTPNFSGWVGSDYFPKRASVDIGIRVPYEEIVAADEATVIRLMEKALLEGIDTIADHEHKFVAPFDYKAFKADVKAIFAEENWYKTEETPA